MKDKHFNLKIKVFILVIIILAPIYTNAYAAAKRADIVYFYITVCETCNQAHKEMVRISTELAEYKPNIIMYNIENPENLELLNKYYEYYQIPKARQHLPCVFVGNNYLDSEDAIQNKLKQSITDMKTETPLLKKSTAERSIKNPEGRFEFAVPFFTGLVNGFNPCALSMLLLFISLLISRQGSIIKTGFAFCLGKFLMFLALGTLLYSFLSIININLYQGIVKILVLILILLVTIINICDYYAAKNEQYGKIRMQLPKGLRKSLDGFIKRMLNEKTGSYVIFFSFITVAVIAVGEFLCTGQLYTAAIINSIREYGSLNWMSFFTLLIYDFGFILPLCIMILAINRGKLVFELSEKLRSRLPAIKLATAAVFLIYGIIFLLFL